MEKEGNYIYTENIKKESGNIEKLRTVTRDKDESVFRSYYNDYNKQENKFDKEKQSEILNEMISEIIKLPEENVLKPAAFQGNIDEMIISGVSEGFIYQKILPRLKSNSNFVDTYNRFCKKEEKSEIHEDITSRVRGSISLKKFYDKEKKEGDYWGINISIDALNKIDAVRILQNGDIEIIQSKTSLSATETSDDIHNQHQKYINDFYEFVKKNREKEKEVREELEETKKSVMENIGKDEKTHNIILDIYSKILDGNCNRDFVLGELNKTSITVKQFILIHSESLEDPGKKKKIFDFCFGTGLEKDDEVLSVLKYITETLPTKKEKKEIALDFSPETIIEKFKGGIKSIVSVDGNTESVREIKIDSGIDINNN